MKISWPTLSNFCSIFRLIFFHWNYLVFVIFHTNLFKLHYIFRYKHRFIFVPICPMKQVKLNIKKKCLWIQLCDHKLQWWPNIWMMHSHLKSFIFRIIECFITWPIFIIYLVLSIGDVNPQSSIFYTDLRNFTYIMVSSNSRGCFVGSNKK